MSIFFSLHFSVFVVEHQSRREGPRFSVLCFVCADSVEQRLRVERGRNAFGYVRIGILDS